MISFLASSLYLQYTIHKLYLHAYIRTFKEEEEDKKNSRSRTHRDREWEILHSLNRNQMNLSQKQARVYVWYNLRYC